MLCLAPRPSLWMDLKSKHKPIPVVYLFSLNPPLLYGKAAASETLGNPHGENRNSHCFPPLVLRETPGTDSNPPSLPLGTPPCLEPSPLCFHSIMTLESSTNICQILDKEVSIILRFLKYVQRILSPTAPETGLMVDSGSLHPGYIALPPSQHV